MTDTQNKHLQYKYPDTTLLLVQKVILHTQRLIKFTFSNKATNAMAHYLVMYKPWGMIANFCDLLRKAKLQLSPQPPTLPHVNTF